MRWSLDFVYQFAGGPRFRILNIVDDVTRECSGGDPWPSILGWRVAHELASIELRGKRGMIVSGTEFTSNAMLAWAEQNKIIATGWKFSGGSVIRQSWTRNFVDKSSFLPDGDDAAHPSSDLRGRVSGCGGIVRRVHKNPDGLADAGAEHLDRMGINATSQDKNRGLVMVFVTVLSV
jgi:hypothetical protein